MILGEDGTYKDFCRWYGGDCGNCPKVSNKPPEYFERCEADEEWQEKYNNPIQPAPKG